MNPIDRYSIQTGKTGKYTFITNTSDLYNSFISSHRDLSYPLRKEVKRDRYILNEQGLQKDIEKVIDESLEKAVEPLIDLVSTDIANEAYSKLSDIHNGITHKSQTNKLGAMLGKVLGKSLVDGITKILND
jgi:hypothetical protein